MDTRCIGRTSKNKVQMRFRAAGPSKGVASNDNNPAAPVCATGPIEPCSASPLELTFPLAGWIPAAGTARLLSNPGRPVEPVAAARPSNNPIPRPSDRARSATEGVASSSQARRYSSRSSLIISRRSVSIPYVVEFHLVAAVSWTSSFLDCPATAESSRPTRQRRGSSCRGSRTSEPPAGSS